MQDSILKIKDLTVEIEGSIVVKDLNLTINPGEVHAIMGPNGSGKSTLAKVLSRHTDYKVLNGTITFLGKNLLELTAEASALLGLFLGFQYPITIPGVSNVQFLKAAVNAKRKFNNLPPLDAVDFLQDVKAKMQDLNMKEDLLTRALNDGFSGGEKKRNEILQLKLLEPKLAILDEIDSGLDIDALKIVADGVNSLLDKNRSFLLITHYQRLLDYIKPDVVHVMDAGKIIHSGDASLPLKLEKSGYAWLNSDNDKIVEG